MRVERTPGSGSLVDVLDRVLDKGIVIDAWVRVSLVGIDLLTVEARVVVASIATYLQYSQDIALLAAASRPSAGPASMGPVSRDTARNTQGAAPHRALSVPT